MGRLVDGKWDPRMDRRSAGARFAHPPTQFRNWVTADGAPGPTGEGGFKAEPGRYHLYVSLACPWAHRTHHLPQAEEAHRGDQHLKRRATRAARRVGVQ